jgi:hypothetical protein
MQKELSKYTALGYAITELNDSVTANTTQTTSTYLSRVFQTNLGALLFIVI